MKDKKIRGSIGFGISVLLFGIFFLLMYLASMINLNRPKSFYGLLGLIFFFIGVNNILFSSKPKVEKPLKREPLIERPVGITILGSIEVLIGAIGILFFFICLFSLDLCASMSSLPAIFILIAGIGILKLRPWARLVNLFLIPLTLVIAFSFAIYPSFIMMDERRGWLSLTPFMFVGIIIFITICFLAYFFTRPKVKEQFK